jgi:type IV secretory pathway VirJ component
MRWMISIGFTVLALVAARPAMAEKINAAPFGDIAVYRPVGKVKSVAFFFSGEKGWSATETIMTGELTSADTLVLGIDLPAFTKNLAADGKSCLYLAGVLQDTARAIEKQLALKDYIEPMVVGFSAGSTMAYAAVAAAPPSTFKGGLALSFCPDEKVAHALCKGGTLPATSAGTTLVPARSLSAPFTVLQGTADSVCAPDRTHEFFQGMNGASVVDLAKVGHDFATPDDYRRQLIEEYWSIAGTDSGFKPVATDALEDLPITEIRNTDVAESETFAIFLSGDGGWADLDDGVSQALADKGIPVVGVSSLKYFWQARTPESVAQDVSRIAEYYLLQWRKKKLILVGYSFGADVMPFAASRLSADVKPALIGLALLGPSHNATFEFHVADWLGSDDDGPLTRPEIERLAPLPVLCIHGEGETESVCPDLAQSNITDLKLSGGHHLGGSYDAVAAAIAQIAAR